MIYPTFLRNISSINERKFPRFYFRECYSRSRSPDPMEDCFRLTARHDLMLTHEIDKDREDRQGSSRNKDVIGTEDYGYIVTIFGFIDDTELERHLKDEHLPQSIESLGRQAVNLILNAKTDSPDLADAIAYLMSMDLITSRIVVSPQMGVGVDPEKPFEAALTMAAPEYFSSRRTHGRGAIPTYPFLRLPKTGDVLIYNSQDVRMLACDGSLINVDELLIFPNP